MSLEYKIGDSDMEKIIDIGEGKIEACIKGSGEVTAVIELGICTHFSDWDIVIDELSKKMRVIAYHRSGYGNSRSECKKRTGRQIVKELNMLLEKENIDKNIILIGHSFGGLCVQHFAQVYPEKVIGMILVDPNTIYQKEMDKLPTIKEKFSRSKDIKNWEQLSKKSKEELILEINPKISKEQMMLSKESKQRILDFLVEPQTYKTMMLEYSSLDETINEIRALDRKYKCPVIVMTRDKELMISNLIKCGIEKEEAITMENTWQKIIKEIAEVSQNGKFIEVKGATHCIYRFKPELIVNEAIKLIKNI